MFLQRAGGRSAGLVWMRQLDESEPVPRLVFALMLRGRGRGEGSSYLHPLSFSFIFIFIFFFKSSCFPSVLGANTRLILTGKKSIAETSVPPPLFALFFYKLFFVPFSLCPRIPKQNWSGMRVDHVSQLGGFFFLHKLYLAKKKWVQMADACIGGCFDSSISLGSYLSHPPFSFILFSFPYCCGWLLRAYMGIPQKTCLQDGTIGQSDGGRGQKHKAEKHLRWQFSSSLLFPPCSTVPTPF